MEPVTREERLMDGQNLDPITREERILAGEDLEVVTRREWFLKKYRGGGGGDITVEALNVTENGTYTAPTGKAYTPVTVELPLSSKTITENGTYTASDDNLAGFNEVTVAVEGYAKKSIENTPTAIATFNASALPMPSLSVSIEAVQSGTGDPSPTNIRPITGWSAVNRYRCGDTTELPYFVNLSKGIYGVVDLGSLTWSYQTSVVEEVGLFQATINDMTEGTTTFSCPLYVNVGTRSNLKTNDMAMARLNSSSSVVLIRNDSYTDAIAFKIAMSGVKLIYELIEPTAPTVTPSEMQAIISSYNVTSQAYTTSLKDGQGNPMECYGGTLTNENGVQTLDNAMSDKIDLGDLTWTRSGSHTFYANIPDMPLKATLICSQYIQSRTTIGNNQMWNEAYAQTPHNLLIRDDRFDDVTSFISAIDGVELCYSLATPTQIPQDSLPISSQSGTNNLWADSGDIQSGEYMEAL